MSLYRILLRSLHRGTIVTSTTRTLTSFHHQQSIQNASFFIPTRSFAFTSAEEAAAERRRRKRRLRIEPPIHALRSIGPPPQRDPNAPKLPDSTSALVGPRLNLHNRVQSLIRADDLDSASVVARQSVFSNTRPTVFTCNAIIAAMYRGSRYNDAIALFHYFFRQFNIIPNVVSYNMLIATHCDMGNVDEGLKVYQQILAEAPFSPSPVTYRHLTKGLIDAGRIGEAVDLLREMLNKGHGADSLVYNNLISGFLKLENLDKANELFDELKERCLVYDGVVNATFMDWFFNQGRDKEAMESYKSLLDRQFRMVPATCNVLLEVLLKHGRKTEAWTLFDNMLDNHTPPTFQAVNSDTFNMMVNECFKLGKISEAFDAFKKAGKAPKSKPFSMDVAGFSNIIARYCEHEMMEDAEKMYDELCGKSLNPDVTIYRNLIDAYFKVDRVDEALQKYTKMVEAGLRVIPRYANKWFGFLIEKGRAAECEPILTKMCERDPKPDVTTYDLVLKALCNEGSFALSLDILGQMMKFGVGVPPPLREFVLEAFDKVGRRQQVEKLLFARYPAYSGYNQPPAPRMTYPLNGSSQVSGQLSEPPRSTSQAPGFPSAASGFAGPSQGRVFEPFQNSGQTPGTFRNTSQVSGYHPSSASRFAGHPQGQTSEPYQTTGQVSGFPRTTHQASGYPNARTQHGEISQVAVQVPGSFGATGQVHGHPHTGYQFAGNPQKHAFGMTFPPREPSPSELQAADPPRSSSQDSGAGQMPHHNSGHFQMTSQVSGTSQFSSQVSDDLQMAGQRRA